ncbi:hypothetical protein BKA82DRAFT_4071729 [Pisolithus tinctorius]|nr:hypothetical protein BKA82DRAFT_4071729 [Pisolithus tinctorius]
MPQRPELPTRQLNPNLKFLEPSKLPPVKYQSLDRDGHEVLVGRLKIPTQGGHAFILRRYDTGAISLTTMFRAAFPTASEADERKETQWVKETYDLAGNNGSVREPHIVRLAGTWVSPSIALLPEFAECYSLADVIARVANSNPDPNISYRRSTKGGTTPKAGVPTSPAGGSTMTVSATLAPTPKRRRESSPVSVPTPQPSLPPPRRSTRTKSPAAVPLPLPTVKSPKSVRIARTVRVAEVTTPGGSDETVVDEEAETIEMAKPSMSQDIAEQKELIDRLKAERDAQNMETDQVVAPLKRVREDEEEPERNFNPKEPELEERKIATNKRVSRFHLEPRQKSFAWGVAAFAIGMGAMSFLPNFF